MCSNEWNKQLKNVKKGSKPSLLWALFNTFGLQYCLVGLVVFFEEATKVIQPLLLGGLIRFFTPESQVSKQEAWLYAFGVSMCAIILAITHHPYFFCVQRIGMRMRVACCSLMYKKCLRLSNKALGETTVGQIVNLMSNDVNRFDQAVVFLHFLWVGPMQAIAVLIILWHELGPSVLAGFFVLLLLIPVQGFMGKLFSKLRHKTAVHTDERVKVMNEIISGMRVIKMYCWEKPFGELVEKIRKNEVKEIHSARHHQAFVLGPYFISAKLILFATFTTIAMSGSPMTAYKVFFTSSMFQAFRLSLVLFMPFAIQHIAEMKVIFRRLQVSGEKETLKLLTNTVMTSELVFVTFGQFQAMKIPLTIFIPFSVQYIAEMKVVARRVETFCHANVFIFWDTGKRLLIYPIILTLLLLSKSLRSSYLYLVLPMLHYVNIAITVRGLLTVNSATDGMLTVSRIQFMDLHVTARLEYVQLVYQSFYHSAVNLFYDAGHRMLIYPIVLLLVLTSHALRSSFLYLALPMMYYANIAIAVRGSMMISSVVDMIVSVQRMQIRLGFCHANVNLFYDTGRRFLIFPIVLSLVLMSKGLRSSYLYLVMPMLHYVNMGIAVRGSRMVNSTVDMVVITSRIQVAELSVFSDAQHHMTKHFIFNNVLRKNFAIYRTETQIIHQKSWLDSYIFIMSFSGRRVLVFAWVGTEVVITSGLLRPSHVFLVWPLMTHVNFGMVFRLLNTVKHGVELLNTTNRLEIAYTSSRNLLVAVAFLMDRCGQDLFMSAAVLAIVINGEPLRAKMFAVMALMFFVVSKLLVKKILSMLQHSVELHICVCRVQRPVKMDSEKFLCECFEPLEQLS
ncbi:Multidrug resistance-associated protein 4 [Bulinus truncatus]|nr:Multidrug resistance-associated protein 4 [Bulinus truncatus]